MIKQLIIKIADFENKSGLKLYEEIKDDMFKINQKLKELEISRNKWRVKYFETKNKKA